MNIKPRLFADTMYRTAYVHKMLAHTIGADNYRNRTAKGVNVGDAVSLPIVLGDSNSPHEYYRLICGSPILTSLYTNNKLVLF